MKLEALLQLQADEAAETDTYHSFPSLTQAMLGVDTTEQREQSSIAQPASERRVDVINQKIMTYLTAENFSKAGSLMGILGQVFSNSKAFCLHCVGASASAATTVTQSATGLGLGLPGFGSSDQEEEQYSWFNSAHHSPQKSAASAGAKKSGGWIAKPARTTPEKRYIENIFDVYQLVFS